MTTASHIVWPLFWFAICIGCIALFQICGGRVLRIIERATLALFFLGAALIALALAGITALVALSYAAADC